MCLGLRLAIKLILLELNINFNMKQKGEYACLLKNIKHKNKRYEPK